MSKRKLTVITNSEAQAFRDCRMKWWLGYDQGLRPKATPKPLGFGSAYHAGVAVMYDAIGRVPADEVISYVLENGLAAIDRSLESWRDGIAGAGAFSDLADRLDAEASEMATLARSSFTLFVRTFREDFERCVPIAVEIPFRVPLRNASGRAMPNLVNQGVIDAVLLHIDDGDIVVHEHKTSSGSISDVERRLELDSQSAGYIHAARVVFSGRGVELAEAMKRDRPFLPRLSEAVAALSSSSVPVARIAYNVARKKIPSVPKTNKDGRVSVAAIDTLPGMYAAALQHQEAAGISITDEQRAVLANLMSKGNTFVGRVQHWRSTADLDRWERETIAVAKSIRSAERDESERYRNPGHCAMPWSLPCSYRAVCLDDAPETRSGFDVRPRHVEVEEALEAKEGGI